jgi:hypothetical protein
VIVTLMEPSGIIDLGYKSSFSASMLNPSHGVFALIRSIGAPSLVNSRFRHVRTMICVLSAARVMMSNMRSIRSSSEKASASSSMTVAGRL